MRLDVITIFPQYLRALELSLIGRAVAAGTLEVHVHDLRRWAHDRHRTVDGTPVGGGPGMVMRPDVWGRALDAVLGPSDTDGAGRVDPAARGVGPSSAWAAAGGAAAREAGSEVGGRTVLVVPTPSGEPFTQRVAEDLAGARALVLACGRYEGIDARVAQYYQEHYRGRGVEVRELSIGDYVLSGGEVAALVVIEAVARLLPGVLGNPGSVAEESHGADGLLEHASYTRPVTWRGLEVDPVLLSGDHARVSRFRRDQALARTARRRPDMVAALEASSLDGADRAVLARHGWVVPQGGDHPVRARLRVAGDTDVEALVDLAARTFPDACPADVSPEQVAAHVAANLSAHYFATWVEDPRAELLLAEVEGQEPCAAGYALLLAEQADDSGALPVGLDPRPGCVTTADGEDVAELSKIYVDAAMRGSGLASGLMHEVLRYCRQRGVDVVWLGTSTSNRRAQKAYRRAGFTRVGTRTYSVGGRVCHDVVMVTRTGGQS